MKMNFEFPREPKEPKIEGQQPHPRLRYIDRALELLEQKEGEANWKDLYKNIGEYQGGVGLSDEIRRVVREYVASRIPKLKDKASSIEDLPDSVLLNALTHNWFEELENEEFGTSVEGQRREVLLMVMAHVVRRIENFAYRKHLGELDAEKLAQLGLTPALRDLLNETMDASVKADPLFIRFRAYAALTGTPPESASPEGLAVPGAEAPLTIAALFPHETQFLAKRFDTIASSANDLENVPGGVIFKNYLSQLANYYREADPERAKKMRETWSATYRKLIEAGFPIVLTAGVEGYYKEPYIDPELKISVATPDALREEDDFRRARDAMAERLSAIGAGEFSEALKNRLIRSTVTFGSYGVNLSFNAVAQEEPAILLYINEQARTYDHEFYKYFNFIENPELVAPAERERMCRMITMLHEYSHSVFPDSGKEAKRLGRKPLTIIDEIKAETLFRAVMPEIVAQGGVAGSKKAWAEAILAASLQTTEQQPEDDEYFYADSYILNYLFASGAISFDGSRVSIKNVDEYYQTLKAAAGGILDLYEDPEMTQSKAARWIREQAAPSAETQRVVEWIKKKAVIISSP